MLNSGSLAWLFTSVSIGLAILPAALRGTTAVTYRPDLAVLTATLIGVIWYTRFTYDALQHAREAEQRERVRARESLATASLAELKHLEGGLRQVYHNPGSGVQPRVSPVLEHVLGKLTLFSPNTCHEIARFSLGS